MPVRDSHPEVERINELFAKKFQSSQLTNSINYLIKIARKQY